MSAATIRAMTLHYTKENHIARIVLDNPPVNVFTPALHKEFFAILKDFVAAWVKVMELDRFDLA